MFGMPGLDDYRAAAFCTASSSRYLDEQLCELFRGSEVGAEKARIAV